jgi:hypothetical protein
MAYTLKYQIANYTVSQDGLNMKLSNTRLHHGAQHGGPAQRHDKQHGGLRVRRTQLQSPNKPTINTEIFTTKFHRVTTGNMAIARNTILDCLRLQLPEYTTERQDGRHTQMSGYTAPHPSTTVAFTGLYLHLSTCNFAY